MSLLFSYFWMQEETHAAVILCRSFTCTCMAWNGHVCVMHVILVLLSKSGREGKQSKVPNIPSRYSGINLQEQVKWAALYLQMFNWQQIWLKNSQTWVYIPTLWSGWKAPVECGELWATHRNSPLLHICQGLFPLVCYLKINCKYLTRSKPSQICLKFGFFVCRLVLGCFFVFRSRPESGTCIGIPSSAASHLFLACFLST